MQSRIKQLFSSMDQQSIAYFFSGNAIIKTADQHYPFQVNKNFFYLTGLDLHQSVLVLIKHKKEDVILFAPTRSKEKEKWEGILPSFDAIKKITGITDVRDCATFDDFHASIFTTLRTSNYGEIKQVYLDISQTDRHCQDIVNFSNQLKSNYPEITIQSSSHTLKQMRTLKNIEEIQQIKEAIKITNDGLQGVVNTLKQTKKEHLLHAAFVYELNKQHSKEAFDTIIASGKHATILHYIDNDDDIPNHALVLCDLGAQFKHYNADITRTYPASGKFTDRQKALYQLVLDVNQEMIAWIKPGKSFAEFKALGKEKLAEKALNIGLIREKEDISKYYYHGLGHHLGLDVHDPCDYDMPLKEGMVLTVEPGIYIEEEGIGIRIEDDILVTKDGYENLSKAIPKTIQDIENLFK
ncbi:MAG: aminopeptidase P family protein [Acholeplasmataceae bacterium]